MVRWGALRLLDGARAPPPHFESGVAADVGSTGGALRDSADASLEAGMAEKNCRTPAELDAESARLQAILREGSQQGSETFEKAARKACDSTLARVIESIADGPLADPWTGRIRAILELRKSERAAKR